MFRGVLNIVMGLVFVGGGLSGKLVFRGTGSSALIAGVGVVLLGLGIYRVVQARKGPNPA